MSRTVEIAPEAEAHLVALYRYLAAEVSPETARRFTASIEEFYRGLSDAPHRGTRRDDLIPGLRTIGFRRRVTVAFMVEDEVVRVVGIFYGGQDFEAAFQPGEE